MKVIRTKKALMNWRSKQKESVGFVPTMGALHSGHLALVKRARRQNRVVVVSIFVNPTQFAPHEDFKNYPRTESQDLKLLADENVDVVFLPSSSKEIFDDADETKILPRQSLTQILEGRFRPGHFEGVATVVFKLFQMVRPARAFFGEKDYQQLCVIRAMVEDLFLPIQIVGVPTVREKSGLAMSSRNQYLDRDAKIFASHLLKIMMSSSRCGEAKSRLKKLGFRVQYLESWSLDLRTKSDAGTRRWLVAAYFRGVRLIDNIVKGA